MRYLILIATTLLSTCGATMAPPATGDSISLSLMVGGINYAATLLGKGDGYFVIIR